MKGQKEAVVEAVMTKLPHFVKYQDIALNKLHDHTLEEIKDLILSQIMDGSIEYSKDRTNFSEVRQYARSMVMNHLKKAKELNGNIVKTASVGEAVSSRPAKIKDGPKGVNMDILPETLKEFAKTLK